MADDIKTLAMITIRVDGTAIVHGLTPDNHHLVEGGLERAIEFVRSHRDPDARNGLRPPT